MQPTATELRDQGIALVTMNHEEWIASTVEVIRKIAAEGHLFTSDDVLKRVPPPTHPNAVGAAMRIAKASKVIKATGHYVQSKRPSSHARVIAVWESV
jgi:hypothetical protein